MSNLVALITGASRGIGLQFVRSLLAQDNWHVVATCRNPDSASELQALQESNGDRLTICQLDVNDAESFVQAREFVLGAGIEKIDYLIANAALSYLVESHTATQATVEEMFNLFTTNVVGVMHTVHTFLDLVQNLERKLVAAISSALGSIQDADVPVAVSYRVSKTALNMLMKGFVIDPACEGVNFICLHPGWVDTDMGNSGGVKAPKSVDESVNQLLSVLERAPELIEASKAQGEGLPFVNYNGDTIAW
jgi:NAD(P)-dependent dehydrogenase (short-subunit alcohol dehydrogenase family)